MYLLFLTSSFGSNLSHLSETLCYNCNETGHISKDCDKEGTFLQFYPSHYTEYLNTTMIIFKI